MIDEPLVKGKEYLLTYTRPIYDPETKRYAPDKTRFQNPRQLRIRYGGIESESTRCFICGRYGTDNHAFFASTKGFELFISNHCLKHESTRLWPPDTIADKIEIWYDEKECEHPANGDFSHRIFCRNCNTDTWQAYLYTKAIDKEDSSAGVLEWYKCRECGKLNWL